MIIRPNQPSNPKTGTSEKQSPKPFANRTTPAPTNKPPEPENCIKCGI